MAGSQKNLPDLDMEFSLICQDFFFFPGVFPVAEPQKAKRAARKDEGTISALTTPEVGYSLQQNKLIVSGIL